MQIYIEKQGRSRKEDYGIIKTVKKYGSKVARSIKKSKKSRD